MDLSKSYDYFKPELVKGRIHIIGCGAVGSTVAELLVRAGIKNITLYDFDYVEAHNNANQMYREIDIGKRKVDALKEILTDINSEVGKTIVVKPEGYNSQRLSGYVFLCLDNIDLRRKITQENVNNNYIKAVFDIRIRLEDAQHYAADWSQKAMIENLIASMDFTHEEAVAETPRTACNLEMSIAPTVRDICSKAVANFMVWLKGGNLKKVIFTNSFSFDLQAF